MSGNFEIRKEVVLEATPEQVWQAITTPQGLAGWAPPPHETPQGTHAEHEPHRRLAIRYPAAPDGTFHAGEYLIEGRSGTTVLRFVHSGFLGDNWDAEYNFEEMNSFGWDLYLHTLAQYLQYFQDRPATYVEAEAPPATTGKTAWAVLQKGLGLTGPVNPGEPVRLTLDSDELPPIEGVVDYVDHLEPGGFLGLRTSDGLYRFHDRAPIGLPIAVGHHLFSGDVDRQATERAWKSWLDRLFA